jgi:hypothetical protein
MGVDGHNLTVMKYDVTTHKAAESRTLYREPDSMSSTRPGFPCVLPDNGGVVFVRTDSPDFTGQRTGGFVTTASANVTGAMPASDSMFSPVSDLYLVDVASGTSVLLAQAMGFNSQADADAGKTYLPFGQGDLHHNFIPSVSPVAQGGFFWVFFDSLRNFGHLGLQRQLWVAALDIQPDGKYTQDVSHPPFYLPGQAFGVGNHRAFATLDECRPVGASCTTGIDCCAGTTCNIPDSASANDFGVPVGTCGAPPPTGCSAVDERCSATSDCCDLSDYCINGFCAWIDLL